MGKSVKNPTNVSELIPDNLNFNKGNPFGEGVLNKSSLTSSQEMAVTPTSSLKAKVAA